MSYLIDNFSPIVEYVDEIKINPYDTNKVSFTVKGDPITVLKWCRRNFGNRGDGWDFVGGTRNIQVTIWSSKLKVMWELWQE
jgi:hypothetical protein